MADPTSPPKDVYEAAARALAASHGARISRPSLDEADDARTVVDAIWPAGVAAGRAQAAADIRAASEQDGLHGAIVQGLHQRYAEWAARIAEGGEPR